LRLFGCDHIFDIMREVKEVMTDYEEISVSHQFRGLRPIDTLRQHRDSFCWLEDELKKPFSGKTVIVSHHAPGLNSIDPQYRKERLSAAYASDLSDLEGLDLVGLWLHGHSHYVSDYKINTTRVLCSARGYAPSHLVDGFNVAKIIDIGCEKEINLAIGAGENEVCP